MGLQDELMRIDEEKQYYAVTFVGNPDGSVSFRCYTHWVGWVNDKPGYELRAASLVRARKVAKLWDTLGEFYTVVNTRGALSIYFRFGGHALIEQSLGEEYLSDLLAPVPVAKSGSLGFRTLDSVPKRALKRAPTPKHRMRILNRDEKRCRICGRSADDYVDVELHVHHIRPVSRGGLTEDENLITLCHTCHKGLDPHQDLSLFDYTTSGLVPEREEGRQAYYNGVRLYREEVKKQFGKLSDDSA